VVRVGVVGRIGGGARMSNLQRAFFRTFLIQGSFNYDRMIGVGLAYSMEPLVRDMGKDVAARSAQFFNAHPYMAGLAAGALARAERDGVGEQQVMALRNALVGALGAVGDRMFWAGVLPIAAGVGLSLAARVDPTVGAVVFLLSYNLIHIPLRWWGIGAGWENGLRVASVLTRRRIQRGLRVVGPLAGVSVGVALPLVVEWLVADLARAETMGVAVMAAVAIIVSRWVAPSFGGIRFGLLAAGLALIGGALWV
jgi:mannose/fructose/N-acetylgalactosamine-specific phosphotransferase system component IID